ncbi:hypothetical protein DINM_005844 [Dirofilaria immitis]|nr:hypothetical protein [Dirofilaria immitis]
MIAANDLLSNSSGKYRCFDPKMRLSTILVLLSAISFSLVFSITSEIKKARWKNKAFLLPRKILPNFAMETLIKLIYTEMDQLLRGVDKIDIIEVIDASAKIPPSGILRGHVTVFGQYKECMLVKQQLPNFTRCQRKPKHEQFDGGDSTASQDQLLDDASDSIRRSQFRAVRDCGTASRWNDSTSVGIANQCSFLEESVICSVLTEFGLALQKSFRYAFVAITIERFIAMCCYQHYEKWRYPIALVFLPLTWIEMALDIKDVVLTCFQSPYIPKSYCSSILNSDTFFWTLTLEIPPLIVIFFLLLITRVISKRKMILHLETRVDTLSSRYQIRENMKTSKTMFIATIIVDYMRNKAIKCLSYFGCHISNEVGDESMNQSLSIRQHIEIVHEIWNKKLVADLIEISKFQLKL